MKRETMAAEWEPDPWLLDEHYLAVNIRDKGVMVFTACSHAGLINISHDARDTFVPTPLYGVMEGNPPGGKTVRSDHSGNRARP